MSLENVECKMWNVDCEIMYNAVKWNINIYLYLRLELLVTGAVSTVQAGANLSTFELHLVKTYVKLEIKLNSTFNDSQYLVI